ncbi:MAG: hypothetical protein LBP25_00685 [Tannerellaceae bacterium]|jgi:hypothetical protein|nr:hypothetical protein [Tannerellaceae bacterium]
MKKVLFVFVICTMALQFAFAQGGRVVTIYFHNGSIVKGIISKLPNEERFKIQTPNNSVILFVSSEVRDILYEDGTRPGAGNRTPSQSQPQYQSRPPQPRQEYVPESRPYGNRNMQQQPQNARNVQPEPLEEEVDEEIIDEEEYDEDIYDEEYALEEEIPEKSAQKAAPARKPAPASDFVPGYHGIVEFGYTLGMGDSLKASNRMELTVTQGYRFSPAFYAGLGFGVHLYSDSILLGRVVDINKVKTEVNSSLSYAFPVFVDIRYSFMPEKKIVPFINVKLGYSIGLLTYKTTVLGDDGRELKRTETMAEGLGLFAAPSAGVKFMLGRSMAFSLGVGYSMQVYRDDRWANVKHESIVKKTDTMGGLTFRAGLEF